MKTYVIRLEENDDAISARDKMSWSKAGRILLWLPKRTGAFSRRIDLVLLQRHGQHLGAQVALVTRNPEVTAIATLLGIPVFATADEAQAKSWRRRRQLSPAALAARRERRQHFETLHEYMVSERRRKPLPVGTRLAIFGVAVAVVLTLGLFLLPQARISLTMAQRDQHLSLEVWANPGIVTANVSGGLPAQRISVVVEGQEQTAASGVLLVPQQRAVGWVRLTNLTTEEVPLPRGMVVRVPGEDGARFETGEAVIVPAGPGTFSEIAVHALQLGEVGNVAAGQITAIEGIIGTRLTVTNPEATMGGADQVLRAPTEQDYARLRAQMIDNLSETALVELSALVQPGQILIPDSLTYKGTLFEQRDPKTREAAERLTLTLRLEFEAWVVEEDDLEGVVIAALDAALPPSYLPLPETINVVATSDPVVQGGSARWRIQATRRLQAELRREAVIASVLGSEVKAAVEMLQAQFNLQSPPQIAVTPAWWGRLPVLPYRIEVLTQ